MMDETDKPKGPFEMQPLGDEFQKQLERAQESAGPNPAEAGLPEGVITELPDDDTESVPYDPANAAILPDYDAEIQGHKVRIHATNSFRNKFAIIIKPEVKTKGAQQALETNSLANAQLVKDTHLEQLAYVLLQKYPKLYQRAADIINSHFAAVDARWEAAEKYGTNSPQFEAAKAAEFLPKEQAGYNAYFLSKAYDALNLIAREGGANVDLKQLTE